MPDSLFNHVIILTIYNMATPGSPSAPAHAKLIKLIPIFMPMGTNILTPHITAPPRSILPIIAIICLPHNTQHNIITHIKIAAIIMILLRLMLFTSIAYLSPCPIYYRYAFWCMRITTKYNISFLTFSANNHI